MWGTRIKSAFYALAMLGLGLWPGLACAQSGDIVGPDAFDGSIDLRASVVGGEAGWLESGFGKLRWGGDNGESQARARIAAADLAWKPRFTFNLSGLVSVVHQAGQSNDVDLNEAFLSFRSNPARWSGRLAPTRRKPRWAAPSPSTPPVRAASFAGTRATMSLACAA